jgi:hypothetical protein
MPPENGKTVAARAREELLAAAADLVGEFQDANDAVDEAAAAYFGVGRSELRCLGVLAR